jgi:hypothetical protein
MVWGGILLVVCISLKLVLDALAKNNFHTLWIKRGSILYCQDHACSLLLNYARFDSPFFGGFLLETAQPTDKPKWKWCVHLFLRCFPTVADSTSLFSTTGHTQDWQYNRAGPRYKYTYSTNVPAAHSHGLVSGVQTHMMSMTRQTMSSWCVLTVLWACARV